MAVGRDGTARTTSVVRARSTFDVEHAECAIAFVLPRRWGTAPERNRARRRIRHAARELDRRHALPGGEHLIRPRRAVLELQFDDLVDDLAAVLLPPRDSAGAS